MTATAQIPPLAIIAEIVGATITTLTSADAAMSAIRAANDTPATTAGGCSAKGTCLDGTVTRASRVVDGHEYVSPSLPLLVVVVLSL